MKNACTSAECAALARIFSSSAIKELAHSKCSALIGRMLIETGVFRHLNQDCLLSDVFDYAYKSLAFTDNRNEYIYKNVIALKILLGKHSLNTSCMLTEFRSGRCKADVVLLNGTSSVYEIKSERDKLSRLQTQIDEYVTIFDNIQVIIGENHLTELAAIVPKQVGILLLNDRIGIREYRRPTSNVRNVSPSKIFDCLQRKEYLEILQAHGVNVPDVPNTIIYSVAKELFCKLTPDQAHKGMVTVLKSTRSPIALRNFVLSVPKSLKAAAVSISLNAKERQNFLSSLETSLGEALSWAGE